MMTSKLFLVAWGISGLMIATSLWDGGSAVFAITAAVIGGGLFSAVVTFIWGKLEKRM